MQKKYTRWLSLQLLFNTKYTLKMAALFAQLFYLRITIFLFVYMFDYANDKMIKCSNYQIIA